MKSLKSLLLIVFCLVALAPVCRAENYALLIGIDEYKHHDSINSLSGAGADAKALAKTLVEVAGFKQDNVRLLTSDGDNKPDRDNIIFEIEQFKSHVKAGDVVFLFYSGHGIEIDGVSYLIPWDTDLRTEANLTHSALPTADIASTLSKLPAKALILVFDMCRSDPRKGSRDVTPNNTLGEKQARSLIITPVEDGSGPQATITLFSCKPRERSWEWEDKARGYYSYFLEQGLRQEAADGQGVVRVKNLVGYLEKAVYGAVQRDKGQDQTPYSSINGTGANDLVLATGRPAGNGGDTAVKTNGGGNSVQALYDAAMQKGYELRKQQDWDGALLKFAAALELNPNSSRAANEIGWADFNKKDYDAAEKMFRKAIELDPTFAAPTNSLGYIYLVVKHDYDGAEKLYRKAMELDPNYEPPVGSLGTICFDKKDYDQAEKLYQKAMELDPKDAVPVYCLGNLYYVKKDYDQAEKLCRQAIELDPKFALPVNLLGTLYYDTKKDYSEAEKLYRKAIELDPKEGLYYANLAVCLLNLNRRDEALTEAKKAIELGCKDQPVYKALGLNPQ